MRNILEDLYFGKITPNEQDITPGSPLQQAMDQAEKYEEKLTSLLEGEEKTMLLRLLQRMRSEAPWPWRILSWGSDWGCEWPLKLWTRMTAV